MPIVVARIQKVVFERVRIGTFLSKGRGIGVVGYWWSGRAGGRGSGLL